MNQENILLEAEPNFYTFWTAQTDPASGQAVPGHEHEGACQWIKRAVDIVQQRDPQAYVIGENADIWNSQHIPLWWNWAWGDYKPEVFRYTMPDSLQSWTIDAYEHQDQIGRAFSMGFLLGMHVRGVEKPLSVVPEFAERIQRLAALRHKTKDFTVMGRFLDQNGLELDGDAAVTACVYRNGDALGVVVGNNSRDAHGVGRFKFKLDLDSHGLSAPCEVRFHRENGCIEKLPPQGVGGTIECPLSLERGEVGAVEVIVGK